MFPLLYCIFLTFCALDQWRLFLQIHQFICIVNIHLLFQYWCRNLNLKHLRVCLYPYFISAIIVCLFYFSRFSVSYFSFFIFRPSVSLKYCLIFIYFLNTCFLTAVRSFIHIFGIYFLGKFTFFLTVRPLFLLNFFGSIATIITLVSSTE